jgi:hypothetical protein
MKKQYLDLSRPLFSLTVGEWLIINNENKPIDVKVAEHKLPRQPIKGIHALAAYLGVCPAKAQSLKNSGILPYFQNGRIVLFDCDKIDEVMYTLKKTK